MPRELTPAEQLKEWQDDYAARPMPRQTLQAAPQDAIPAPKPKGATGKAKLVLEVARGFNRPFTEQDLTYHAWHEHPEAFGLKGYESEHADRHIVRCTLFGRYGLLTLGLLRKRPEDGLLEVTP